METKTPLGVNRTGVQMSPFDTSAMQSGQDQVQPMAEGDREDLQVRLDYADATDGLGSVPVPGTLKGVLQSGADMISGRRPQVLVDKLGERLAFERGGTRLYDTLLVKCRAAATPLPAADLEALTRFREQERQHAAMVSDELKALGADPTAQTPCADLVGVESMGLVQAMNDPRTSLGQSLHVMLDAELIDNAGWDLLIELARASGHDEMADRFSLASQQEVQHLILVRRLVERLTMQDASLLGGTMDEAAADPAAASPA